MIHRHAISTSQFKLTFLPTKIFYVLSFIATCHTAGTGDAFQVNNSVRVIISKNLVYLVNPSVFERFVLANN